MIIIFATIFCISDPTGMFDLPFSAPQAPFSFFFTTHRSDQNLPGDLSPTGSLVWLTVWRIILGIGVGADYPMSASVTSDRTNIRRRGTMLAYIFSNQGWGSFVGSILTIIVLACYKHVMDDEGEVSKVDGGESACVIMSYRGFRHPEARDGARSSRSHERFC